LIGLQRLKSSHPLFSVYPKVLFKRKREKTLVFVARSNVTIKQYNTAYLLYKLVLKTVEKRG